MKAFSRVLALGLVAATLACGSTTFLDTWRSPDARPLDVRDRKVLAVFVTRNEAVRRRAEDTMAREISARGARGVPSYTLLSASEASDEDGVRRKIDGLGFAGSVAMRVVSRDTEIRYEPGLMWSRPYYRRFWGGYWRWGWANVYEPPTVRADRVVSVETLVYSFAEGELVWAGVSRTVNPDRVEGLVTDLSRAVAERLEKEGLVRS